MAPKHLKIAFIRRGFSRSGGAEAYLKRLAAGVCAAGHEATLVTSPDWPPNEWPFGELIALPGKTPMQFADAVDRARLEEHCDLVMSLERVRHCDVFRAGDGVHRAWLERRGRAGDVMEHLSMALNSKHQRMFRLEEALFKHGGARRVIANSLMVKREIESIYGYPAERIDVVTNGVPVEEFRSTAAERKESRKVLDLTPNDFALLFVGSGWERKGLADAVRALKEIDDPKVKLFVAGRGNDRVFRARGAHFLGEVDDLATLYRACDLFVLPTLYDPFSNACLEALASGLPVVTTHANGFSEIMTEGVHGSVFRERDVGAMVAAIRYWSNAERRAEARPVILELAARYDIARNVERTLEILLQEAASAASTSGKIRNT
ncbi:MAG: glycosyltransferase family 4 protein [Chthoniobacterales bacterium]